MRELTQREIQLAELDILVEFDRICRENHLRYSLAGGTLLGAIRHNGFIPWDDDIDVCMPRPDYEKFRKIFADSVSSHRFFITYDRGEKAVYPFLKLQYSSIEIFEKSLNEVEKLWIDIFPVDGLPFDNDKVRKIYNKSKLYRKIIVFDKWKNMKVYAGIHSKFTAFLINIFVKFYGAQHALRNSIKLALKFKYEDSEYVGAVTWGCYGIGERMLKSEYEKSVEVDFEGRKFLAMSCWDSYLHGIYGDYMTLPPEEKRIVHGFKAYRVEENE